MDPLSSRPEPLDRVEELIAAAQGGSLDALGRLLETSRPYLLRVANAELNAQLQVKAGGSDLVQETFLEAQRIFARFQGESQVDLLAWLRAILLNKVATFSRQYLDTDKRQVGREVALDAGSALGGDLSADTPTPSTHLARKEQAQALTDALSRLPEPYRQVIVWRQWDDLSFGEIAQRLGRSVDAARMMWWRAVERLQQEMGPPP